MAKRKRDYAAEYARRIEKGKAAGLTKAQARRGAKKYAKAPPREHVSRETSTRKKYGVSPRQVTRQRLARKTFEHGGATFYLQRFHGLSTALDFAGDLPDRQVIYIMGHGKFSNPTKYNQGAKGWAALTGFSENKRFRASQGNNRRMEAAEHDALIFDPHATTYEVRWRAEK